MAIPLAIGYLALPPRKPLPPPDSHPRGTLLPLDDIRYRPAIPRGVVTWPDVEVPRHARERAVPEAGRRRFDWRRALRLWSSPHVDES